MATLIQDLIEELNTSSDSKADAVIAKLIQQGPQIIAPLIAAAKDSTKPRVQKWSLQALGVVKAKKAAPLLVDALKDERMTVRLHALKGLEAMNYKKSVKEVIKLLKDESGGIRVNALYVLMTFADRSASTAVKKTLLDPQWYVRQNAAKACGVLKISSAKKKLLELSKKDERKAVRTEALAALALLQK